MKMSPEEFIMSNKIEEINLDDLVRCGGVELTVEFQGSTYVARGVIERVDNKTGIAFFQASEPWRIVTVIEEDDHHGGIN